MLARDLYYIGLNYTITLISGLARLLFKIWLEEFVERSSSLHETGMWEENGATEA